MSEPTSSLPNIPAPIAREKPWVQLKTFTSKPAIFRSMVGEVSPDARQGDVVSAYDKQGSFIGYGFWNAGAPIALRILKATPGKPDDVWFEQAIRRAAALRKDVLKLDENTDAYRVVNADAALHLADFRAAERTCQLVTQVAGRSGRGPLGGRVVVQTSTPDHPAIRAAATHDYEAFVRNELPAREALLYPPYGSIVRMVVRSIDDRAASEWAGHLVERLRRAADGMPEIRVLGPAPAPIARLRDRFRWHLQMHGPDGDSLRAIVARATVGLKTPDNVAWIIDVDPVDML